ncbi:MAG: 16S rRNA (adenine(1518)-N(6)/adenine(1519)-N(6))-dimethyltransferase RsmA [Patescibacteria group bacterium]
MRQRLGQHFLINKGVIQKIVNALSLKEGDFVVEIGPGHGELTKELVKHDPRLNIVAIEKDLGLAASIRLLMPNQDKIEVVEGDALKVLGGIISKHSLEARGYKIVGNIPYYITGYLLRLISELENKPELVVLTIQKEVADRVCAKPPKMNLLAASVQFWAEAEIIEYVPKEDFSPAPEVDSAIIRLTTRNFDKKTSKKYYETIRILFKQPRKTILNNILDYFSDTEVDKNEINEKLRNLGIKPSERAQNLDIETIKKLSQVLYN